MQNKTRMYRRLLLGGSLCLMAIPMNFQNATAAGELLQTEQSSATTNPLMEKWTGNYGGVPPPGKIQGAHF